MKKTREFTQKVKILRWRAVFAESALIGLSILLAFALQDWDEQKDIEERTKIALCNVKSELSYNRVLINSDYLPRQKGLALSIEGAMSMLSSAVESSGDMIEIDRTILNESLRYSAWSLAAESGYLLHANFELATEIGALFDFQEDQYKPVVSNVSGLLFERESSVQQENNDYFIRLLSSVNEWTAVTNLLSRKYENLFSRTDFINLDCQN